MCSCLGGGGRGTVLGEAVGRQRVGVCVGRDVNIGILSEGLDIVSPNIELR